MSPAAVPHVIKGAAPRAEPVYRRLDHAPIGGGQALVRKDIAQMQAGFAFPAFRQVRASSFRELVSARRLSGVRFGSMAFRLGKAQGDGAAGTGLAGVCTGKVDH